MSTAREPLVAGQRMSRAEYHECDEAIPPGTSFTFVAGKVSMASLLSREHSDECNLARIWLGCSAARTPGNRLGHDGSLFPSNEFEVQPDLTLPIEPRLGGQIRRENHYTLGGHDLRVFERLEPEGYQ